MTEQAPTAIRASGVGKAFTIYDRQVHMLTDLLGFKTSARSAWVLKNISFEIARGEVVGVIGPNGAGKSTLLKILAGTMGLSEGHFEVNGRVSAILELGMGFHPEYTGRENIVLGGLCMGLERAEIAAKIDWVVEFSELADVIDQPLRTYSSGMQSRLAFATAISIDPDILIIDEALATGDSYFVFKCLERIREICGTGATVVVVSHSMDVLKHLCDRIIWIDGGELRLVGNPSEVILAYEKMVQNRLFGSSKSEGDMMENAIQVMRANTYVEGNRDVWIEEVSILNGEGVPSSTFIQFSPVAFRLKWRGKTDKRVMPLLRIENMAGIYVTGADGADGGAVLEGVDGEGTFELRFPRLRLGPGDYILSVGLRADTLFRGKDDLFCLLRRCLRFSVKRESTRPAPVAYAFEDDVEWSSERHT